MKYMIMMFGGIGAATQNRSPQWIAGMHELLMKLDTELKESGECVASDSLADPSQAKTVRFVNGAPAPTDGPFTVQGRAHRSWLRRVVHQPPDLHRVLGVPDHLGGDLQRPRLIHLDDPVAGQ